jgi:hypothetical protein
MNFGHYLVPHVTSHLGLKSLLQCTMADAPIYPEKSSVHEDSALTLFFTLGGPDANQT